ncbi:MAG: respiratory nitrate reductase subunit gamma [Actinobacteria bacterium]|nr:respiratory nitrate reductase subunit gamma [Actinomycetota bacterium]
MDLFSFIAAGIMVYIAVAVFLGGMAFQIYYWAKTSRSPVRLGIFPKPKNRTVKFFKLLKDSFIFPHSLEVDGWMWTFAIFFHFALAVALFGHFRLLHEFTPIANLIGASGMDILSSTAGGIMGSILLVVILYYLFRRFFYPFKELSVFEDYVLIFLLIAIIILGDHLRFFGTFHVEDYRAYVQSLLLFKPAFPSIIAESPEKFVLSTHVLFVNLFVIYFPFSKLTHAIGTFVINLTRSDV